MQPANARTPRKARPAQASFAPAQQSHLKKQINLLRGWPAPSLLPATLISEAAQRVLAQQDLYVPALQYGPDEGDGRLRDAMASWLSSFYYGNEPDAIQKDRIFITGGASQSLGLILATVTDPVYTRNIWISAPAYFMSFRVFQDAGYTGRMRSVREDDEGMVVDDWERLLVEDQKAAGDEKRTKPVSLYNKVYKHVLYLVPSFSNPSSRTMSVRRREQVVRVARQYDVLVICDDVYDMLWWPTDPTQQVDSTKAPILRVLDVDRRLDGGPVDDYGHVVSNGSFSKICGPGVRTGWVEAADELAYLLSQNGYNKSGGAASHLTATFMAEMVETGVLKRHVKETLIPTYARRWSAMMTAIQQHLLPLGLTLPQSDSDIAGGYFLWLTLPDSMDGDQVTREAFKEENLVLATGRRFEVPGDDDDKGSPRVPFANHIRICFAWEDEDKLDESIQRLATVIKLCKE